MNNKTRQAQILDWMLEAGERTQQDAAMRFKVGQGYVSRALAAECKKRGIPKIDKRIK